MEIMPNSTLKFLRNIPFDNDYNDTIYFDNPASQYNYFSGNEFLKYELSNQYYTRHSEGVINVELPLGSGYDPITHEEYKISTAESLFDCNYIMFCNESFRYIDQEDGFRKKKWFYAFITEIEYVNNEVARVTFEIDAMQSWMFDYELEQCFIEREHSATDIVGENLVDEGLEIGSTYLTEKIVNKIATMEQMSIVALSGKNDDGTYPEVMWVYNNIPSTLVTNIFPLTESGLEDFYTFYWHFTGDTSTNLTPDDIVVMYLFPTQRGLLANQGIVDGDIVTITRPNSFNYLTPTNKGNFYLPKNKKLLTYPYIGLEVSNHEGTSELYRYEYFLNSATPTYQFKIKACDCPSPALILYPLNYHPTQPRVGENTLNAGYDYGIPITDFQQCAWVGDAFKAWWAQNKSGFVASAGAGGLAAAAQLTAGIVTKNPYLIAMGAASAAATTWSSIAKVSDAHHQPAMIRNLSNTLSLPIAMNYFGYTLRSKTIAGEYAQIIDEYFSMYGYATHRVKTPNRHVRKKWTFTQTRGCTIRGRLPSKYQREICKIYDNGIRFWDKSAQVGEYRDTDGELYNNECLT